MDGDYEQGVWGGVLETLRQAAIVLAIVFGLWFAAGFFAERATICDLCGSQYTDGYSVNVTRNRNFLTAAKKTAGKAMDALVGEQGGEAEAGVEVSSRYDICPECQKKVTATLYQMTGRGTANEG